MPLFKRTPFALLEPPGNLKPNELVFQIRFTKEIFRDYKDYLNRLNLYRQRVWTCKATWKGNLTYEEALVSEHRAAENFQRIPVEHLVPILQMVQYSTLKLKELVDAIIAKLQGCMLEGMELHGRKDESICPCKILKLEDSGKRVMIGWLDKQKLVFDTSTVDADSLVWKKLPINRILLKSFIRESTSQSAPWVVHEKLARKYGLQTDPPKYLYDMIEERNIQKLKKRKQADQDELPGEKKIKKLGHEQKKTIEEPKYPIDDFLVKPGADDPVFANRPPPCRDFMIPLDCVGDLLMVWDFCSLFGRVLNLWPFSLEDFEKAISHKDGALVLIIETHSMFLNRLIKDEGEYAMVIRSKKRKSKIKPNNWNEYLCDFLEFKQELNLSSHISTIKRGHYSLLDVGIKLTILHELVNELLATDAIKNKIDEYHKSKQLLAAARREEAQSKREAQSNPEVNGTDKEETKILEVGMGDVSVSAGDNTHPMGNEGNLDGGCSVTNQSNSLIETDGSDTLQNGVKKLEINRRKLPKELNQNGATTAQEAHDSVEVDESQKKKRPKKEADAQGSKNYEQKQNVSTEKERQYLRTNTLGRDRDHNRYWFFRRDGRLFIESKDSKQWGFYASKDELDTFLASLNPKGVRERALELQLRKHYEKISSAMQKRCKDIIQRIILDDAVLRRSTRVRAQPRDSAATTYLRYTNKWSEA